MARIDKHALTKMEIVQEGTRLFVENGYSATTIKLLCKNLEMSPGNVTFYFATKEHLLAELIDLLCSFQWELMRKEVDDGLSSVMAIGLELTAMATMCEDNPIAKDLYISAYTSPICLDIIRKNDVTRAKEVFRKYCEDWTDEQFIEAEILVSGIEYATLMTTAETVSLESRIRGALDLIWGIYGVPEAERRATLQKVFSYDYRGIGEKVLKAFKEYVEKENEMAIQALLKK